MSTPPVVLAVAGTDSGGAAGLAADLATIGHLGAHAACVVSAVTAQDTTGVHAVHPVPLDVIAAQVVAVRDDLPVAIVKTGMLGTPEVVRLVAETLGDLPLVVDPVLVATSGAVLGDADVVRAYRRHLLPTASVITPNLDEARALTGTDGTARDLAQRLADTGCAVVLTGGDEAASDGDVTDWLAIPGQPAKPLMHPRVATGNDHGTGCSFSSAIAAVLATDGPGVTAATRRAAAYVAGQLAHGRTWRLGRGRGPVPHVPPTRLSHHKEMK